MSKAIVVCGHGTKNENGIRAFFEVFNKLKSKYPTYEVDYGFIEYSEPLFGDTIQELINKGMNEIIVVPTILYTGVHLKYDIPYIILQLQKKNPGVSIKLASCIGNSEPIVQICLKNLFSLEPEKVESLQNNKALLLIGVGSSIIDANVDIAALTRILWEKGEYKFANYAFISKMTFPTIEESLDNLLKLPYDRIHIIPILLFPGVYLDKILLQIEIMKKDSVKEISVAQTLDDSTLIVEAISQRINEVINNEIDLAGNIPEDIKPRK